MRCYANLRRRYSSAGIPIIPIHSMPARTLNRFTRVIFDINNMLPLNPKNVKVIITIALFIRLSMSELKLTQTGSTISRIKNTLRCRGHIISLSIKTSNVPRNRLQRERCQINNITI